MLDVRCKINKALTIELHRTSNIVHFLKAIFSLYKIQIRSSVHL